ncbi:MAG: DUF255 domain-containing protein [Bacteroidales bacterium]|nr:DUF255 domain-containing protein [Bacteroidales bacterium]
MRKILVAMATALLLGCTLQAQEDTQEWQVGWVPIIEASQRQERQKLYFVDFSTSWCGWCRKMDNTTFQDPVVAAILNQYYIPVKFNAEGDDAFSWGGTSYSGGKATNGRPVTHSFTRAVLGQKIGYPSFAIFGQKQNLLTILQGYQNAYDFSMALWYIASGDNTRYTFEKYQQIFDQQIKPDMMKKLGLAK